MSQHLISRRLEIDAGHRVPDHGSKCKNLHGHRYVVECLCSGPLAEAGVENGMVLDFGFLKAEMAAVIDERHDHGLTLFAWDEQLEAHMTPPELAAAQADVALYGSWTGKGRFGNKITLMESVPTAENLAAFWFDQLEPRVHALTDGRARVVQIKVWETPNCWASYPA
ncbi:MAG: 6-carboxytetrahydropterin synthase [Alphaproteobacteria bacterium]